MKIVIDARELRTSSGRYVERLLHYLQKLESNHSFTILLKPDDMDWQPTNPNFQVVACPHKEFTFAEQRGLKKQIESLQPDLVHFPFPQQPIWYKGKIITTIHDLTTLRFTNPAKNWFVFKLKQQVYRYVIKRAVHKSVRVIVPSQFVKNDVAKFAQVNPDKIIVTYEAADPLSEPSQVMPDLVDKQFIMYIGRPTPHKNLRRLVEAFKLLKTKHPNLQLVLAGQKDTNYQRLETAVQNSHLKDVVFLGSVSDGQLKWLFERCQAYVFPSLSEGFGLPGLEAMLHGAPVVSSKATCLPEVYGVAAHYFDPLDTQAMVQVLDEVLTNKALRNELIAKGRKQAAKYSWQDMARQTLEIYNQV